MEDVNILANFSSKCPCPQLFFSSTPHPTASHSQGAHGSFHPPTTLNARISPSPSLRLNSSRAGEEGRLVCRTTDQSFLRIWFLTALFPAFHSGSPRPILQPVSQAGSVVAFPPLPSAGSAPGPSLAGKSQGKQKQREMETKKLTQVGFKRSPGHDVTRTRKRKLQ